MRHHGMVTLMSIELQRQPPGALTKEERQWGMLNHLSGLAGFFFPFGNIIAPLILWSMKKDESSFLDAHGKEAMNFQISIAIYTVISIFLVFVLVGIPMLMAIGVIGIVFPIIAALKASNGEDYTYPLTIRFLK